MADQGGQREWQTDLNFPARCVRQGILASCVRMRDKTRLLEILSWADFDPDEVFESERETCCLLCMMITHNWTEGLSIALYRGADVNKTIEIVECCFERTRHTITPLMAAMWSQRLDCAAILVQFGADINYMDPESNMSILHVAVYTNNPEAVQFLTSLRTRDSICITGHDTIKNNVVNGYVNKDLANQIEAVDFMDIDVMVEDVIVDDVLARDVTSVNNIMDVNRKVDDRFNLLTLALHNMGYCVSGFIKDPAIFVENSKKRQSHCLSILRMILAAGGEASQNLLSQSPQVLFNCCTGTDTRVLRLFIQYGADVNARVNRETLNKYHRLTSVNDEDSNSTRGDSTLLSLLTYFLLAGSFEAANLVVDFGACVSTIDYKLITTAFSNINNCDPLLSANQGYSHIKGLYQHVTNAPTLIWLCWRTLRVDAGVRTKRAISKLPLPELLKHYQSGLMEL